MWNIDYNRFIQLFTYDSSQPLFFNSGLFLFLFLAFMGGYALLSGKRTTALRLGYLTAFSYFFYYKNAGDYCALLALVTLGNYGIAWAIDRSQHPLLRKLWVTLSVTLLLGQLAYFKYTNFALQTYASIVGGHFEPLDIF
ncbi:alginate O-acetylation protein, partial [gut metagenome]